MKKLNKFKIMIATLLIIATTLLVLTDTVSDIDLFFYRLIHFTNNKLITNLVLLITNLGGTIAIILITILSMFYFKKEKYKILSLVTSVTLTNQALKYIIARPRPMNINVIEVSGYSFPSGHAMISTAMYGYLTYLLIKKTNKKYLLPLSIILISLISLSRVYLGVHYVSDILVGASLGYIFNIVFQSINIIKQKEKKICTKKKSTK